MSSVIDRAKQRPLRYIGGAFAVLFAAVAIFTCSSSDTEGCGRPAEGSAEAAILEGTEAGAVFTLKYPCSLPAGQKLVDASIVGNAGSQSVEYVFEGAFDLTVRQSQFPPAVSADPAGASRTTINLFPNVRATFIQVNDGSSKALYHLFWEQNDIFYELQAVGPPLQQDAMIAAARSLQ